MDKMAKAYAAHKEGVSGGGGGAAGSGAVSSGSGAAGSGGGAAGSSSTSKAAPKAPDGKRPMTQQTLPLAKKPS